MGKEYTIYKPQGDEIIEVKTRIPALGLALTCRSA